MPFALLQSFSGDPKQANPSSNTHCCSQSEQLIKETIMFTEITREVAWEQLKDVLIVSHRISLGFVQDP